MQIERLHIKNLRSIREIEVQFDRVTALLGGNNVGKSTVIRALFLFFEAAPSWNDDDFFMREASDIVITITFNKPTPAEVEEFGTAIVDERIIIRRIISRDKDKNLQYEVYKGVFPAFSSIRNQDNRTNKRVAYNKIADSLGLPQVSTAEAAEEAMIAWESSNPGALELTFLRAFFGAPNVANGKLRKKTSLHVLPAVADAVSQTADQKRSPIILLLNEIARQIYENKEEVRNYLESANKEFFNLVDPSKVPQLIGISERLTAAIKPFYKDSKLIADWQASEGLRPTYPQPSIKVEDNGFTAALESFGHGLQRIALFSIVQFLAERSLSVENGTFESPQSDIILLIEEPEIYQHPQKQILIEKALHKIASTFSAESGIRFQVIFTTHSEKMVSIEHFDSIRILRRSRNDTGPSHVAAGVTLEQCCSYFASLVGREPMTAEAFASKMHIFSREICEGFFANKVIFVEGVTDKAVLEGAYFSRERDPLSESIAIISVDGKTKLDKPLYIFNALGIPCYAVFDSDKSKKPKEQKPQANILIQRICGVKEPVDFPDGVFERFCAFEGNVEDYIFSIAGRDYQESFLLVCGDYDVEAEDVTKTPNVIGRTMALCRKKGFEFRRIDDVIDRVDAI